MPGMAGAEQGLSHMQQVIYWVPKSSDSGNATWSLQILPGPFHTETPQMEMPTVGPTVRPTVSAVSAQDAQRSEVQVLQTPVEASCTLVTPCSTEAPDDDLASAPRMSSSAARRLRRKRALERSRGVHEHGHVRQDGAVERSERSSCDLTIDELRVELRRNTARGMQRLRGQVWRLSRDAAGCRLVQEALELGGRETVDLAHELQGHVLEAVTCPHANYVVQKVVSHLSVAASSFVVRELQGNAVRVAKHRFACRIFCRLLEFSGTSATSQLVDELLETGENLCTHSFAHHVIQSILEHGEERHKHLIAKMLTSELWTHATHKNSSYLIEKALCYCSQQDQEVLVGKLGHPEALLDLALNQYGSFVARSLLQDSRVDAEAALGHLQVRQADVEATKHGHRFLVDVGVVS